MKQEQLYRKVPCNYGCNCSTGEHYRPVIEEVYQTFEPPVCDECGLNDQVLSGPGFPASEHWCDRCANGWMQPC